MTDTRRLPLTRPLDLRLTLGPFGLGPDDPSLRLRADEAIWSARTPDGAATVRLEVDGDELQATAWGPGTPWILDQIPAAIGEHDHPAFAGDTTVVGDLERRHSGLRIGASGLIFEALVRAVCADGVSAYEAARSFTQLLEGHGEPAPGPGNITLAVLPEPGALAGLDTATFHPIGLEQTRADTIRRAAARFGRLQQLVDVPLEESDRWLRNLTGVAGRVSARVRHAALGDPDAVATGDPTTRRLVSAAFLGSRRGNDATVRTLLDPFRPQRARVVRLLAAEDAVRPDSVGPDDGSTGGLQTSA